MTPTAREERLARNEALFRAANERMAEWEERHTETPGELYFCECADPGCAERLDLTADQYEEARSNPRHFMVRDGHQIEDVETVVARHDDWLVVEKPPDTDDTIRALDPRA